MSNGQRGQEQGGAEEHRMRIALLPLRLRLDKHVITFLCAFIAPPDPNYADFEAVDATAVPLSEEPAAPQPAGALLQHVLICRLTAPSGCDATSCQKSTWSSLSKCPMQRVQFLRLGWRLRCASTSNASECGLREAAQERRVCTHMRCMV